MNRMDAPYSANPFRFFQRGVLYPASYALLVFVSALDLLLTWRILHIGGWETNLFAAIVIDRFDLPGVVAFKFGLVVFVILIAEFVGRRRPDLGRFLATLSVGFPATGAVAGAVLLLQYTL